MKKRHRRRYRWALLIASLSLLGILLLPVGIQPLLERSLTGFFHRPVRIGRAFFTVFPFMLVIEDLSVGGYTPQAPPFLEVPRIEIVPSLAAAVQSRLSLSRIRAQGLVVRINAFPQGGDDIPRMGNGAGGGEIRLGRLIVEDSQFILDHARVPLDLDLPDLRVSMGRRRPRGLSGTLAFGRGQMRFGTAPPLSMGADLSLTLDGAQITVTSGQAWTGRTHLAVRGQIKIAKDPIGEFALDGPVDLDEMERHIWRTGFGIKGDGHFVGTLGVEGPRLRFRGNMAGTAGEFDAVPVPRFSGFIAKDEFGVHIQGLEVSTLDGTGVVDVEVPPPTGTVTLVTRFQGIDAERAVAAIFDIGTPGIGAGATGQADVRWPRGQVRRISGQITFDLASRSDGRTPVQGRFEWSARDGLQRIEKADFRSPTTGARLAGTVDIEDRTDIDVNGETSDLAASDDLFARVRRALGTQEARPAGFGGTGGFRGRWRGTLQVPIFEGRAVGRDVTFLGVDWGRVEWAGRTTPIEVESRSLVARKAGAELWLDGLMQTGLLGEEDAVDVRVRYRDWPAKDFITAYQWNLDLTGALTGEAVINGRRSLPYGTATASAPAGRYYGIPFQSLELTSRVLGEVAEVTNGRARVGNGTVTFHGSGSDDGFYDGVAEIKDVEIGEVLPPPLPSIPWGGRVSADMTLSGALGRPRLRAALKSPFLSLGEETVGALAADLEGNGNGRLTVTTSCRSPRLRLSLSGYMGVTKPFESDLTLEAAEANLDPFARKAWPALSPLLGLVVSGTARVHGPMSDPKAVRLDATIPQLEARLPEYPIRNTGPLRLIVEDGRLRVLNARLAGEGTDLVVSGDATLIGEGPIAITMRGGADLRTLSAVTRRLRGRGAARLLMNVSGTLQSPRVEGSLELDGAGLRARGFPHGVEELKGVVRFTETAASFERVKGELGGGPMEIGGQVAYSKGRLGAFEIKTKGRDITLRYPEGLRCVIDSDLQLLGDADQQWLSGTIDVRQAAWTKRYDLATELLAGSTPWKESGSLSPAMQYDIKVRVPGTLRIDNNLATLQARADLTIAGTYDFPVVLGRAEIEKGRVYFQGNTYVIRRGTIDFANPRKTDPLFDIEAETRIQSYRVTLRVNGTLDRVVPTLTSDPPLAAVQILSLLAGADETTVASLSPSQTDQAQLAAAGAATLAAGKISEEVGLEREAERLFGLNRFSIDPSVVKGGVLNPTARLTVGKRVTPDLSVLYSVDLRGGQERVLSMEYMLSDRFSLLLTMAEPGGLAFDVRLRQIAQ